MEAIISDVLRATLSGERSVVELVSCGPMNLYFLDWSKVIRGHPAIEVEEKVLP